MEEEFFFLLEKACGRQLPRRNCLIKSPFREDRKPSFSYFKWDGKWFFKDFATGEVGTAIHLFCKIAGVSYKEAKKLLLGDVGMYKERFRFVEVSDVEADYSTSIFRCTFYERGYKGSYFERIGIEEDICKINSIKFGLFEAKNFRYEDAVRYEIKSIREGVENAEKYYFPLNKTIRFLGNRRWHHLFGANSLSVFKDKKYCFVAAGEKDACVLQQVFHAPAIALSSETHLPNIDMLSYIKNIGKRMVIVYDNDTTGKEYSIKLFKRLRDAHIPVTCRCIERYKDVTDMYISEKKIELMRC